MSIEDFDQLVQTQDMRFANYGRHLDLKSTADKRAIPYREGWRVFLNHLWSEFMGDWVIRTMSDSSETGDFAARLIHDIWPAAEKLGFPTSKEVTISGDSTMATDNDVVTSESPEVMMDDGGGGAYEYGMPEPFASLATPDQPVGDVGVDDWGWPVINPQNAPVAAPVPNNLEEFRQFCQVRVECDAQGRACTLVASCQIRDPRTGQSKTYSRTVDLVPIARYISAQLVAWHKKEHGDQPNVSGLFDIFSNALKAAEGVAENKSVQTLFKDIAAFYPGARLAMDMADKVHDVVCNAKDGDPVAKAKLAEVKKLADSGDPKAQQAVDQAKVINKALDLKEKKVEVTVDSWGLPVVKTGGIFDSILSNPILNPLAPAMSALGMGSRSSAAPVRRTSTPRVIQQPVYQQPYDDDYHRHHHHDRDNQSNQQMMDMMQMMMQNQMQNQYAPPPVNPYDPYGYGAMMPPVNPYDPYGYGPPPYDPGFMASLDPSQYYYDESMPVAPYVDPMAGTTVQYPATPAAQATNTQQTTQQPAIKTSGAYVGAHGIPFVKSVGRPGASKGAFHTTRVPSGSAGPGTRGRTTGASQQGQMTPGGGGMQPGGPYGGQYGDGGYGDGSGHHHHHHDDEGQDSGSGDSGQSDQMMQMMEDMMQMQQQPQQDPYGGYPPPMNPYGYPPPSPYGYPPPSPYGMMPPQMMPGESPNDRSYQLALQNQMGAPYQYDPSGLSNLPDQPSAYDAAIAQLHQNEAPMDYYTPPISGMSKLTALRAKAGKDAARAPGSIVGVVLTPSGMSWTPRFNTVDEADDWFGNVTQDLTQPFTYAAYFDKHDPMWPNPLNEQQGVSVTISGTNKFATASLSNRGWPSDLEPSPEFRQAYSNMQTPLYYGGNPNRANPGISGWGYNKGFRPPAEYLMQSTLGGKFPGIGLAARSFYSKGLNK